MIHDLLRATHDITGKLPLLIFLDTMALVIRTVRAENALFFEKYNEDANR